MDRIRQGSTRTEELNQRISSRNIPSNQLQAQFDIRPVSSKYAKMPIVDRHENHIAIRDQEFVICLQRDLH